MLFCPKTANLTVQSLQAHENKFREAIRLHPNKFYKTYTISNQANSKIAHHSPCNMPCNISTPPFDGVSCRSQSEMLQIHIICKTRSPVDPLKSTSQIPLHQIVDPVSRPKPLLPNPDHRIPSYFIAIVHSHLMLHRSCDSHHCLPLQEHTEYASGNC